ncbi:ABC transporter permease [Microbispora bryophytorum]|uniref:Peptide ABC transporter permease n=1 Tax=Microbispora bryophytorum TaxID=1460882 RepID=A0A8H9L9E4_9ACTN|nr:ABC transporter permease [Microbispora bryophytorum]MBD3140145.1 ABC transporter permease [Microbispora bryophytorum]TQS02260.1 ABC transporter permease [Microbispora bryophytorum]GGO06391.1 peptide ABC transporter permease [Microbispora bryophytorum]
MTVIVNPEGAISPGAVPAGTTRATLRRNFWRGVWRVLRRKPSRMAGVGIVVLFAVIGVAGPLLYPAQLPRDDNALYAPPSLAHPFGTDFEGTDVLALVVTGARYVLLTGLATAVITVALGTLIGLVAGFHRGRWDTLLMRLTDMNLAIPGLPLLLVLSTVWKFESPLEMGLVLGVLGWGGIARAVRSQTLSLRERGFIEAARGLGLPTRHIIGRELLPSMAPYIAMNMLIAVTGAVYAQVGLFFLGVLPFESNNWGVMLNLAVFNGGALTTPAALPYLLAPLIAILLLTLGIVLIVDAMDEIFNPRLREE